MDVDAITPQLVSQTLRAWRIEQEPPPDLLALDLLQEPSPLSPAERRLRLEDLLTDLVAVELERLCQHRV